MAEGHINKIIVLQKTKPFSRIWFDKWALLVLIHPNATVYLCAE